MGLCQAAAMVAIEAFASKDFDGSSCGGRNSLSNQWHPRSVRLNL